MLPSYPIRVASRRSRVLSNVRSLCSARWATAARSQQQEQARLLRAENRTLADIAEQLGVSKSSVSLWVRDVPFTPSKRRHGPHRRPHPQQSRQARRDRRARRRRPRAHRHPERRRVPRRRRRAVRRRGGEDATDRVTFANTDPAMVRFFVRVASALLRHRRIPPPCARVPARGSRSRARRGVLVGGHGRPALPVSMRRTGRSPIRRIRRNKHEHGCAYVVYSCSRTHREVMGLVRALLSSDAIPG